MPTAQDYLARRPVITLMLNAGFGAGKTHAAMTFPKVYAIGCDPSGLEILKQAKNAHLAANLVHIEHLHNESEADLKVLFKENAKATERESLSGCLAHAKELALAGEVETLLIDGFTYLVDMKWQHINEYEQAKSDKTGNVDTQAMYRNLGLYLQRFVSSDLLTMATRLGLNVVLTCHLKREGEGTIQGTKDFKTGLKSAGRVNQLSDIAPLIEGGFRQKVEGLVGASIYLDDKLTPEGKRYFAYCDKVQAWGTLVLGKNRFGLPPKLDITGKSLYDLILASMKGELKAAPAAKS
jgi:hypothetical protein